MNIWKFIQEKLSQNMNLMLMVVVESSGSSPGRQGFKMAVTKNKQLYGSIGGGGMEYKMVELACSLLNSGQTKPFLKNQVHKDEQEQDQDGTLCSGMQTIAFYPLTKKNLTTVNKIILESESSENGMIRISPTNFEFIKETAPDSIYHSRITNELDWEYTEKPGKLDKICIIGAGHVGLALSKLMKDLNFIVEIYDDRLGLNTFENNQYVNKKHKIRYHDIDRLITEGNHVYVVIMTFEHQSDEMVLEKLLPKKLRYLGMMGSKTKVETIFKNIGYNPNENKKKVYAPIGIPIYSQTPTEIAISIAAEIIRIKNEPK